MDRQPGSRNESHRRFRLILSTCGVVATGGKLSVQHLHTRPWRWRKSFGDVIRGKWSVQIRPRMIKDDTL
jgi:hypothetical protein